MHITRITPHVYPDRPSRAATCGWQYPPSTLWDAIQQEYRRPEPLGWTASKLFLQDNPVFDKLPYEGTVTGRVSHPPQIQRFPAVLTQEQARRLSRHHMAVSLDFGELEEAALALFVGKQMKDYTTLNAGETEDDALDRMLAGFGDFAPIGGLLTVAEEDDDCDWEPPSPSTPGDLIFHTGAITRDRHGRHIELIDYEHDGAFYWIEEGVGIEYFVEEADHGPVILEEDAVYVCEGLTVRFIRGRGWISGDVCEEDDEDWEDYVTRPATIDEIANFFGCSFWDSEGLPFTADPAFPDPAPGV